jgi:glycosyltransferase involved in cell wall biosynthesis
MPKIAIDVSPLSDNNKIRGIGYYTKNLVEALQLEIKENPDYHEVQLKLISNSYQLKSNFDLIHYPYFDPFKLTLPNTKIPYIVTVHDLIPRLFKSHFPVGLRGEIKWFIQKYRLKQAKCIIAPSHSAKYSIAEILKYPTNLIFTTPEAADPTFRSISDNQQLTLIKKKYRLPDKFILYVGDLNWNKNIPTLVNACRKLEYPLVIVGSAAVKKVTKHPWNRDILWLQKQSSPFLHLTGFVPDSDLPSIFNLATLYCQPSFAEGFGLPLLQAMQSGTPTLFANTSSLPEISSFSGLAFDPFSLSDLQTKLSLLWKDPKQRQLYSRLGKERSSQFSWKYTALQTLAVYTFALKNG